MSKRGGGRAERSAPAVSAINAITIAFACRTPIAPAREARVRRQSMPPNDRLRVIPSGCATVCVRTRTGTLCASPRIEESGLLAGSVITRSPTQQEPTISSSPISLCPGGHGCAVYSSSVTDAEWAPLESRLPAPVARQVAGGDPRRMPPWIVDVTLYIVRGGTAWRETAGGVPVNRDGVRGLRPQNTCARNSPRNSSQWSADLDFDEHRLHSTGHRNPHDQVQPAVPVRLCRRCVKTRSRAVI